MRNESAVGSVTVTFNATAPTPVAGTPPRPVTSSVVDGLRAECADAAELAVDGGPAGAGVHQPSRRQPGERARAREPSEHVDDHVDRARSG